MATISWPVVMSASPMSLSAPPKTAIASKLITCTTNPATNRVASFAVAILLGAGTPRSVPLGRLGLEDGDQPHRDEEHAEPDVDVGPGVAAVSNRSAARITTAKTTSRNAAPATNVQAPSTGRVDLPRIRAVTTIAIGAAKAAASP